VVLSSGAFDSKTKFLQELRKKYGGGTFNFGSTISGNDLAFYYSVLKEEYGKGSPREFFRYEHHGHIMEDYWVLSNDVSLLLLYKIITCSIQGVS
jgi:hypothetical protein